MKSIYTPKGLLMAILVICVSASANLLQAQNVHPHFYDGNIYLRTAKYPLLGDNSRKVNLEQAGFITADMVSEFGITEIEKPFWRAKSIDIQTIYLLKFTEAEKVYDLIRQLQDSEFIEYAEQVPIHKTTLTPNDLGANNSNGGQWYLHRIKAQAAWDISTGSSAITVAIVDDAVKADHPDLAPSIWVNTDEIPNNNIDDDGNGYVDDVNGYDVADDDNIVLPNIAAMSHGTHVAGISGAATNNGVGIASIGYNLKIIPVKSSNQQSVVTNGYDGIIYAADVGADVINMSWGGSGGGQTGQNIINYAVNRGCIMVAAAGNDNVTTAFYPANYTNVISVASTTTTDAKSSFSNYGNWIDISAPGSAIRSTYITSAGGNTYANLQGTSMASPLVAGLCGLMLSLNPNLTRPQLENCLYTTADPVTSNTNQMGAGRIDAEGAMQCVLATVAAPPVSVINSNVSSGCAGSSVQFQGGSSGGPATSYQWSFPGGNPATSTLQNPVVTYANNGTYSVTLVTTNSFGTDTETATNLITISNAAVETFHLETFESTPLAYTTVNPDNGITWTLANTGGNLTGSQSAFMNFFGYNSVGQRDGLVSPSIDFSQNVNIELSFTHAYRRYNTQSSDSLIIKVSTNNGVSWTRIWQRGENGTGTFATAGTTTNNFVPSAAADWCIDGNVGAACFTVPLGQYDGQSNVRIMFESYNNYGNNLYLDDITIRGICNTVAPPPPAPVPEFSASQNTLCTGESITMVNSSLNATTYAWSFQGGTPATSTAQNPTVQYNTPGTFNVSLTATGPGGSITETANGFVVVNQTPSASIAFDGTTLTASPAGFAYQWYLNGAVLGGANSQQLTPTQNGSYTVEVFGNGDCNDLSTPWIINGLSLENVALDGNIQVYPNPAQDMVFITRNGNLSGNWNFKLLNAVGAQIKTVQNSQNDQVILDLSDVAAGVYYLHINTQTQGELIKKLVIMK